MFWTRRVLLFAVAGALAAGFEPAAQFAGAQAMVTGTSPDPNNGARIYFTGASDGGVPIRYTGGPDFGMGMMGMMSSRLTCASCHGPEGRGGIHAMHMYVMKAPDIRYAALSTMPEMRNRPRPYDLGDFRTAVVEGKHPDGEKFAVDMPRWQMSDGDLRDLYAFLQRLPR